MSDTFQGLARLLGRVLFVHQRLGGVDTRETTGNVRTLNQFLYTDTEKDTDTRTHTNMYVVCVYVCESVMNLS